MKKIKYLVLVFLPVFSAIFAEAIAADSKPSFVDTCSSLANINLPKVEIITTEFSLPSVLLGAPLPAHCRIRGAINKRVGIDGKTYAIGFELRLPQQWNERFLFQGGGGTDGRLGLAIGQFGRGSKESALSRGFAVVSTDAGHTNEPGPLGSFLFALDPQARIDYGYLHLPLVVEAAKQIISTTYNDRPAYSYFMGCSNGGRQGMMASQRYPELFNGIIAGAPAYRVIEASIDAAAQTQALASIAPATPNGRPILGNALNSDDIEILSQNILEACDTLDGVQDGMVNHFSQCQIDPTVFQCSNDKQSNCLSSEKATAIKNIFAGARNSKGELMYSDWPWDAGITSNLWSMWKLGSKDAMPPTAINTSLIAGALSYLFSTPPVESQDLYEFLLEYDLEDGPKAIYKTTDIFTESSIEVVQASSTNLDEYKSKNGKIIFYHGMADAIFSANDTVKYFDSLGQRYGEDLKEFSRLYLVPGMAHCGGGPATDNFDTLAALTDWVEKDLAPQDLKAFAGNQSPWPNRSRFLCPHPKQLVYKGEGSIETADSFACK